MGSKALSFCCMDTRLFTEMDASGDQIQEFKELLHSLEKSMKSLPATVQVADHSRVNISVLC